MKGKLITLDGIDGSGKSTLVEMIGNEYADKNFIAISGVGERKITNELIEKAKLIKDNKAEDIHAVFSQELINIGWLIDFYATGKYIETLLEEGKNIIVDRYIFSAKVYGESTTELNMQSYYEIYQLLPQPDLCFYIDVDPKIAEERINKRGGETTFYENIKGLTKIRNAYLQQMSKQEFEIILLNGDAEINDSYNLLKTYIDKIIN